MFVDELQREPCIFEPTCMDNPKMEEIKNIERRIH